MPNLFAMFVLVAWVPLALVLFRTWPRPVAATIVLLGANVLLPANFGFEFSGFPTVDRHVIGSVAALLGYATSPAGKRRPARIVWWPAVLIGVQIFATFLTVFTNPDPLHYGNLTLPGLRPYDALGDTFERMMVIGVPCFLGMRIIRSFADVEAVLRVIAVFGLVYIPLLFWESRMSPQLHADLYGYFPHSFKQHIRAGGFRPVVFTSHGLEAALFIATAVIAAFGLGRSRRRLPGIAARPAFLLLLFGLVLCKSMGSLIYGLLVPLLMLLPRRLQAGVVVLLSGIVLLYPLLRSQELFPTRTLVELSQEASGDRALSLETRFENEDELLAKARQRLWFGWGMWARHHVYESLSYDSRTESITDGYWIIEIGKFGLVGFVSLFALVLTPIVLAARRSVSLRGSERFALSTLTMLVLVRAIDMIPNAFPSPFTFFLIGGLATAAVLPATPRVARRVAVTESPPAPGTSRALTAGPA